MTKYLLVSFKTCPWVQRAAIVLREKGVAFEFRHIDPDNRPEWFLAMSPHRKVPVDQRKCRLDLGVEPPDHLQHQKLVEVGIEQAADDGVELPGVVVDTPGDVGLRHVLIRPVTGSIVSRRYRRGKPDVDPRAMWADWPCR